MEVLRRYLNHQNVRKSVQNILVRIARNDRTDEPGVVSAGVPSTSPKRQTQEQISELVESFCRGALIRDLATRYGVPEGCIKRKLHRRGVGRRDQSAIIRD